MFLCFLSFLSSPAYSQQSSDKPSSPPLYLDPKAPVDRRVDDLVSRMTLEEKASQVVHRAAAVPRLQIPAYNWWTEALHGVLTTPATVFPEPIGLAASFDAPLVHEMAVVIGTEARAKHHEQIRQGIFQGVGLDFWSPNVNIFRDPRWGRGQETYGEDPYLTSRLAVAFIQGMQGDNPRYLKTVATPKHFAAHSGPEAMRHVFDSRVSARDLDETYLPAFRASLTEGGANSVMCAYNRINGVPACANQALLEDRLRRAWGFRGYVVSDCGAIGDIAAGHKYKRDMPEAAAAAVQAGTELDCGTEYSALLAAVKSRLIPESTIDRAVERLFVARFRLGMFDPPERVPFARIPISEVASAAHRRLALEAAQRSIVLLKNANQTLPVGSSVRRIAVVGPSADDPDALLGNYNGVPVTIITPLEGMERQFQGKAEIRFAPGSVYTAETTAPVPGGVLAPPAGGQDAQHGLLAEYFDNADLSGAPRVSRVEPRVYVSWYNWRDAGGIAGLRAEEFSVRWTGAIRVERTGDYSFATGRRGCWECPGTDSARLFIDDRLVLDDNAPTSPGLVSVEARVRLEGGRNHKLRLEYRQKGGVANVQLLWRPPAEMLLEEAVEAARASDLTVAFVGLNSSLEGEELTTAVPGFAGGDRTDLQLPAAQEQLLRKLIETGKPVVVVLVSGSALAVNYAQEHAAAILTAWYGGEQAGTAIAQTLAGDNNPAGRLPVTFYRSVSQLPPFEDYSMEGRTYRYFRGQPLYPFGYGLSYSTFQYSDLRIAPSVEPVGALRISARVRNTSGRKGDEVVQLYVQGEPGAADPIRALRGFKRVSLGAGESRVVEFLLSPEEAGLAGAAKPGKVVISVGGGQPLAKPAGGSYVEAALGNR